MPIVESNEESMEIEAPLKLIKRGKSLGSAKATSTLKSRTSLSAFSTPPITPPPIFSPENPFQSGAGARFSISPASRDNNDVNPFQNAARIRLSTSPDLPVKTKHTIRSAAAKSLDFNDFDDVNEEFIEDAIRENNIRRIISSPPPVSYENLRTISTPTTSYPNLTDLDKSTGKKKSKKFISKTDESTTAIAPIYFKPNTEKQNLENQINITGISIWNKIAAVLAIIVLILAVGAGLYYYSSTTVFCDEGLSILVY